MPELLASARRQLLLLKSTPLLCWVLVSHSGEHAGVVFRSAGAPRLDVEKLRRVREDARSLSIAERFPGASLLAT